MKTIFLKLEVNGIVDGGYLDKLENTPDNCLKVIYMDRNIKFYPIASINKIQTEIREYPR